MTFVGHLYQQVQQHHGLADKNDDIIEKAHQPWKREKERTWNIKNFQLQQRCQLKSVRKRSHYKVCTKMSELEIKKRRLYSNEIHNPTTAAAQSNALISMLMYLIHPHQMTQSSRGAALCHGRVVHVNENDRSE